MARLPRVELEGGLYHLIARGVERRDIFLAQEDYVRFLAMLEAQKEKLPFYLYAYCLMTNHFHLLIERRIDDVGRIMHRVLSGYSQYFNRKYRRSGHLFQGRHKSILCQSDMYFSELVRYIHLNPVRAKMVELPELYPYSGHNAYVGSDLGTLVDVDPLLRRFSPIKQVARERYSSHVAAGMGIGHRPELYHATAGILGSEKFVDETIHHIGQRETSRFEERKRANKNKPEFDAERFFAAFQAVCSVSRELMFGSGKASEAVATRELLIYTGQQLGATVADLSRLTGLNSSTVSRRLAAAAQRLALDPAQLLKVDDIKVEYSR